MLIASLRCTAGRTAGWLPDTALAARSRICRIRSLRECENDERHSKARGIAFTDNLEVLVLLLLVLVQPK